MRNALAALILVLAASETYRVFDKNGRVQEYWREEGGRIETYDKDWNRKGYLKREGRRLERYNEDWGREGEVESTPPLDLDQGGQDGE